MLSEDTDFSEEEEEESGEENKKTSLKDFTNEILKLDNFDDLAELLEENLDHEGLASALLRTITMLPVRLKCSPFILQTSDEPLIKPESSLYKVLVAATSDCLLAGDAFDAIYTILSFHPSDSKQFHVMQNAFVEAEVIENAFSCLEENFLINYAPSEQAELVGSIVDTLSIVLENNESALSKFLEKMQLNSPFESIIKSPDLSDFACSSATSSTSSSSQCNFHVSSFLDESVKEDILSLIKLASEQMKH
ncbi:uncharacterized protein MONOS_12198 [Monocercomonoides exilis]|uniref:uncharacterized protein n=1 Tax=Monocercomonoides exilis TaxID=2049356 RepID=UPI003559A969|nr:hypothetical protein MONOS_12198 [Monocercomonoides exilis]|eukprot:MONOS_12198.1-p1 / transcript=MONOS_12198.1 / gene=MONOS_12198 / organism=Monocercomonoides_exilis_PA203 / gene_product=unspecified product / transcript_product=unspecified product / location=Mono_scaffold00658:14858-15882(-) / protein_length=250 / sequence_SO=supercontig / SO=protein_coding / is_pseudo=false